MLQVNVIVLHALVCVVQMSSNDWKTIGISVVQKIKAGLGAEHTTRSMSLYQIFIFFLFIHRTFPSGRFISRSFERRNAATLI
jgi:hypothetical protein